MSAWERAPAVSQIIHGDCPPGCGGTTSQMFNDVIVTSNVTYVTEKSRLSCVERHQVALFAVT